MYKENLKKIEDLRKSVLVEDITYEEYSKKYSEKISEEISSEFSLRNREYERIGEKRHKIKEKKATIALLFALILTNIFQNIVWLLLGMEVTWISFLFVGFQLMFGSTGLISFISITLFLILLPFFLLLGFIYTPLDKSKIFHNFTESENKLIAEHDNSINSALKIKLEHAYKKYIEEKYSEKKSILAEIINKEKENNTLVENALIYLKKNQDKSYTYLLSLIDTYSQKTILPAIEENFNKSDITYDLTPGKASSSLLETFQRLTVNLTDKIMIEEGLTEYGLVDITRSTNNDLGIGTYFYSIQKNGDLILMESPYIIHYEPNNSSHYALFDSIKYKNSKNKKTIIKNKNIHDFQLFGSELVESSVQTIPNAAISQPAIKVSVIGTLFNEFLFGSSYATLNGVGKMMSSIQKQLEVLKVNITTVHRINDTRKVQLILKDQSDLELKGISIYYDFNRKMGNVKNKIQDTKIQAIDEPEKKKIIEEKETNTLNSLLEAQKMLKENLITKEEFDALKLEILGSKKLKN
jgi:hypothetical protein